jgi:hypothetical protein
MVMGGILLLVAVAVSSCASEDGSGVSKTQNPAPSDGVTIGPETVAPGSNEYESPWPFGPLGMD